MALPMSPAMSKLSMSVSAVHKSIPSSVGCARPLAAPRCPRLSYRMDILTTLGRPPLTRFAGARAQGGSVENGGKTPMSRPHTFAAACQPKKIVASSDVGGKTEPAASLARKKEPAGVNLGMQHSVDELQAFSYGQSAHAGRDMVLRRPMRSAEILQVNPLPQTCVCNSANVKCPVYLCVCDHVCTCSRVIVHAHTLLTHFLINTRTYVRIPGGQSIIRSSRSCRGRCVTIVRTRLSADTDAYQSLFGKQGRTSQARKPGDRSKLTKNGACTLTNTAAEAADGARRRRASGLACCAPVAPGSTFISFHAAS